MRKRYFFILVVFIILLTVSMAWSQEPVITRARKDMPKYQHDSRAVRALNPKFDQFPDSSLVDFSYLLNPPAGKHGFVVPGDDGHFRFEKTGERVRFWGVTVASDHVDIPKERIDDVVDVLARAGCNLLRLHELDNRGAEKYNLVRRNIIEEGVPEGKTSQFFNAEYRDRVDYWIHRASERGMYVYLVIRGYRTFRPGDNVAMAEKLDRKAKPYGYFDERLLDLQDEYIVQWLFEHKNPYTGLPNGLNPAVCLLELINEDSLLFDAGGWRNFIEPYRSEFQDLWNEWLKEKYGDTKKLREAWTVSGGEWSALTEDENLEDGTVEIPDMKSRQPEDIDLTMTSEPLSHPLRQSDGVRFAVHLQRKIFARQRDLIRSRGCPVPLTAVVNSLVIPDTWSVAQELDFIGQNAYQDHPSFKAGETWVGQSFFKNTNYLKQTGPWSYGPFMARYNWADKPVVCREWALCWPNEYRSSANIAMATHALLHDYDGMIYFAYYTWGTRDELSAFGLQADPARWGNFGYASQLFLKGEIKPIPKVVDICYTEDDLFRWGSYVDHLHNLAWEYRVRNHFFTGAVQSQSDIRISSGRSGMGVYTGRGNILWDVRKKRWGQLPDQMWQKSLFWNSGYRAPFITGMEDFSTTSVKARDYKPLLCKDDDRCGGFFDPGVANAVLAESNSQQVCKVGRGLVEKMENPESEFKPVDEPKIYQPSDGVVRNTEEGVMTVNSPSLKVIQGELKSGEPFSAGSLSVITKNPVISVTMASAGDESISVETGFSVKAVTGANNRGQILKPVEDESLPGNYVLAFPGNPPVQTGGESSEEPMTTVMLEDQKIVEVFMQEGTWEIVTDPENGFVDIFCDTPNVRFRLGSALFGGGLPENLTMTRNYYEYPPGDPTDITPDFVYPGFTKYVRLRWE